MTEEQLAMLRQRLAGSRQPTDRTEQYAFPRGWNEALAFVERVIGELVGETGPGGIR